MSFISDEFLLSNEAARRLYHEYAASEPILDYHCHLPPRDVAENRPLGDTTTLADPTVVSEIQSRAEGESSDDA